MSLDCISVEPGTNQPYRASPCRAEPRYVTWFNGLIFITPYFLFYWLFLAGLSCILLILLKLALCQEGDMQNITPGHDFFAFFDVLSQNKHF